MPQTVPRCLAPAPSALVGAKYMHEEIFEGVACMRFACFSLYVDKVCLYLLLYCGMLVEGGPALLGSRGCS